jgi:hypothetical protein
MAQITSTQASTRAAPAHDKDMAAQFLATLDPGAREFTFQFFNDTGDGYPPQKVTLRTPRQRYRPDELADAPGLQLVHLATTPARIAHPQKTTPQVTSALSSTSTSVSSAKVEIWADSRGGDLPGTTAGGLGK